MVPYREAWGQDDSQNGENNIDAAELAAVELDAVLGLQKVVARLGAGAVQLVERGSGVQAGRSGFPAHL
jgi:hypothetical protein